MERPVIICTVHRGVFFGYTARESDAILTDGKVHLRCARMAIYWGTTRGVMQLAATGPTSSSKISLPADIAVNGVTAVFEVSPEALQAWGEAK